MTAPTRLTCDCRRCDSTHDLLTIPTGVPGLALVWWQPPCTIDDDLAHTWTVTHEASGLRLPYTFGPDAEYALAVAQALADDADWTADDPCPTPEIKARLGERLREVTS